MSTETPRTDAAARALYSLMGAEKVVNIHLARELERDLTAAREQIEKLAAFKAFVHECLDRNGVPTDPPGKMRDEGCRVGQRLKYLADERDAARARVAEIDAENGALKAKLVKSRARVAELEKALKPFANFACDEPCQCNNCVARALLSPSPETKP